MPTNREAAPEVSEAMVERAAKGMFERSYPDCTWETEPEDAIKQTWRDNSRAALRAAQKRDGE